MRVHERGAGITEACGTGAVAAAWAASRWGLVDAGTAELVVHMDGGSAKVSLDHPAGHGDTDRPGHLRRHASRSREPQPVQRSTRRHAHRAGRPRAHRARRRHVPRRPTTRPPRPASTSCRRSSTRPAPTRSARMVQRRDHPDHTWFIGKGKADELHELCLAVDADTVVFDNELSPAQQFNLEKLLGRTAIDRTAVILDIFAQNAHTLEGKAQVELALLRYRLPRLRRGVDGQAVPAARRRRHPLRWRRDQAGGRPPADHAAHQPPRDRARGARAHPRAAAPAARPQRARRRHDRRLHQRRQVDAAQHAHRRRRARPRTASSPRSTRRPGAWRSPAASRCCSPTPSASCGACRTGSSSRSRARSRSPAAPTTSSTSSTPPPPIPKGRSPRCARCSARSAPPRCPSCSSFNKADLAPDAAKQLVERPSRLGGRQRHHRRGHRRRSCARSPTGCAC